MADALQLLAAATGILALTLLVVIALWWTSIRRARRIAAELEALAHAKRSQSTRYGQITEQFAPFLPDWPWDPKRFRFLGDPIDGIQFTDEGIVLVEIKSAASRLSLVQRQVRDHVEAGRVTWRVVRVG